MAERPGRLPSAVMVCLGAGTAVLLSAGLEACFGVEGYCRIMVFGVLAGVGAGIALWYGNSAGAGGGPGTARRLFLASAIPALVVLAVLFLTRILPLIQEELRYSR